MFFKPLFEKAVGKKDLEATVAYTSQGEGAEPGLEAMVNQLVLDVGEGRLPDFLGQWGMSGHLISLLLRRSDLAYGEETYCRAHVPSEGGKLSTFFPQGGQHCNLNGGERFATYPQECSIGVQVIDFSICRTRGLVKVKRASF
jgi:hypothetical protein